MSFFEQSYAGLVKQTPYLALQHVIDIAQRLTKETFLKNGFSGAAVDMLRINVQQYCLTLTPEEKQAGITHDYADGQPFCVLNIRVDGATGDDVLSCCVQKDIDPRKLSDQAQALWLMTVIANNLPGLDPESVLFPADKLPKENPICSATTNPATGHFEMVTRYDEQYCLVGALRAFEKGMKVLMSKTSGPKHPGMKF